MSAVPGSNPVYRGMLSSITMIEKAMASFLAIAGRESPRCENQNPADYGEPDKQADQIVLHIFPLKPDKKGNQGEQTDDHGESIMISETSLYMTQYCGS